MTQPQRYLDGGRAAQPGIYQHLTAAGHVINHAAWLRAHAEGGFVGTCAETATDTYRPGPPPRVTRGPGSDVRRWRPACTDHSYGDPRLSDDAARYVPEQQP